MAHSAKLEFVSNEIFMWDFFFFHFAIDRVHILEDRSLRLENVGLDDMGEYTCEADNAVGAIASTGNLIVYGELNFISPFFVT